MTNTLRLQHLSWFLQSLLLAMLMNACAGQPPPPLNPVSSTQQSIKTTHEAANRQPLFYDFPDVPIPYELTLQPDDSYTYQVGQIKAGVLNFRGRVDLASLIHFFQVGLIHEGWSAKGECHYRRSLLIFEKPGKTCVVCLYDSLFFTYADICVIPSGGKA